MDEKVICPEVVRKPYKKPGFVLETELEVQAGTVLPYAPGMGNGTDLIDPNKLLFP